MELDSSRIFLSYQFGQKKIWLTTPYFIPDEGIRTALKVAALGGIDVKLILPGFADHKIVFWASHSYIDEMLSAGIRVFCYEKGFIHSKVLLVDDGAASVGTANIDNRSLDINFEVQAFIYDNAVVERLARDFIKDLSQSREYSIESRRKRSLVERVKESGSRLMSSQL